MANNPDDEAEILALIKQDHVSWWMRDYEGFAECYVHEPYALRWGSTWRGGSFARQGWNDAAERARWCMAENPEPNPEHAYNCSIENLALRVNGDMAWASFDQVYPGSDIEDIDHGLIRELRVFERHSGRWKIAVHGWLDGGMGRALLPRIRLDPDGRVLSISAAAKTMLADDDDLVIRNCRLRVRDRKVDSQLQAAIGWAAGVDSTITSRSGAVPVVMESGEGLPTKIWWVEANSGHIHLNFASDDLTDRRIDKAALIFGLSPAQARLAAFVAEGLPSTDIAERMGITANTARTHLNRVFDKVGVRTQTALVRVLLSAVAPN